MLESMLLVKLRGQVPGAATRVIVGVHGFSYVIEPLSSDAKICQFDNTPFR